LPQVQLAKRSVTRHKLLTWCRRARHGWGKSIGFDLASPSERLINARVVLIPAPPVAAARARPG
jgi:hypothetical protein